MKWRYKMIEYITQIKNGRKYQYRRPKIDAASLLIKEAFINIFGIEKNNTMKDIEDLQVMALKFNP